MSSLPLILRSQAAVRDHVRSLRKEGLRVAFVPTMGALHEGHLTLLRQARKHADCVLLSIFVNPTQFGPNEDLARYPRDFEGDVAKAASAGADVVFAPDVARMYPEGFQTYVEVREVEQGLCGAFRPGHFIGVATVVLKLLNAVMPDVALFGEKDYQQLAVIRRMVLDLDVDVEIVGVPIVREADGLAMSSRNAYLNAEERTRALSLYRAIEVAREAFASGERRAAALADRARAVVAAVSGAKVDYVELRDAKTLAPIDLVDQPARLLLAVWMGKTRLIDNAEIG